MLAMSSYEPDLLAGICAIGKEPESPAVMSEGNPMSSQYTVQNTYRRMYTHFQEQ
jgi:hypothetical protein